MASPKLQIRRYHARDRDAVLALHNLALEETGTNVGGSFFSDLDDIDSSYLEAGGEFLVGIVDGELVAMGGYLPLNAEAVEIRRMRVHPGRQRQGYGKHLLANLEQRARQQGFHTIRLETTTLQLAAKALYKGQGYREVSRGAKLGFDTETYEKRTG